MNTDVSCSFSIPQKFAAPLHPTAQTHRPWVLQAWGSFTSPKSSLLLSPSSCCSKCKGVMCLLNSELQVRQETLPPLPSCTATSFLHPSPERDTFCSSPLKGGSYIFISFRKWIASGWGGCPGARKDIIQQHLSCQIRTQLKTGI